MADSVNIPASFRKSFELFQELKGKTKEEFKTPFWDLVVLTTSDEEQKYAFELQLEQKIRRKEIPLGVPYHVFSDPPGPKAGCGTSTMNIICLLQEMYGSKLKTFRVLLLNCGGQSQRLPSASILGKVFMALPFGSPPLSLFEFKMFQWLPLLERMAPGYMHSAADTVEVYDLGQDSDWTFERPGFTAIAHPSSLAIGSTHGVYVLKGGKNMEKTTDMREARFVLQKPSEETMRKREAVLQNDDGSEFVYTDSTFFFDHEIGDRMASFYRKEAPLNCEIDGYADFLQPLGEEATIDYTKDLKNVSKVEPRLVEVRQMVFNLLKGTPLHVVAMNGSKFYHLGTMVEYLYHFCEDEILAEEMGFSKQTFCKFLSLHNGVNGSDHQAKRAKLDKKQNSQVVRGTQIQCLMNEDSEVSPTSIVEFCNFEPVMKIGDNCIISSCSYTASSNSQTLVIPDGTFMHTVAIEGSDDQDPAPKYVTVAFHVEDSIKKKAVADDVSSLPYFRKPLSMFCASTNLSTKDVFKAAAAEDARNLWYARLFAVSPSMSDSFHITCSVITAIQNGNVFDLSDKSTVSMSDILRNKDPKTMLEYRDRLYNKIRGD